MNPTRPASLPASLWELILALQIWLADRQATLGATQWLALRDDAARFLDTLDGLIASSDFAAAERVLRTFSEEHATGLPDNSSWRGTAMSPPTTAPTQGLAWLQPLRRVLGMLPTPAPITTHPLVHCPEKVPVKTAFFLEVTARPAPTLGTTAALTLNRTHHTPVDLEVELQADPGLQIRGADSAILRILPDGQAATLQFEVFAAIEGSQTVMVTLRSDGVERVRSIHQVFVLPSQKPSGADVPSRPDGPSSATLHVEIGRSFAGLVLRVLPRDRSVSGRAFRVLLSGPCWIGPPAEGLIELPSDSQHLLAELCRDLPSVTQIPNDYARSQRLRNLGSALTRRVLPLPIAQALSDSRYAEGTALHIESEEAWIPWEALWLTGSQSSGTFLGEHFAVTRWLHIGSAREHTGGNLAVLVAPRYTRRPLNSEPERVALRRLTGIPPVELRSLPELMACLNGQPPCHILHFAGHGCSTAGQSFGDSLSLEDHPLHPIDIHPPAPGLRGHLDGMLVFLNACQAGIAQPGLWDFGGFATAFLHAGVSALIAPSWTVTDLGAAAFSDSFYCHAATGIPLGEAARQARLASARLGTTDHLGYALYCAPTTTLKPCGSIV